MYLLSASFLSVAPRGITKDWDDILSAVKEAGGDDRGEIKSGLQP